MFQRDNAAEKNLLSQLREASLYLEPEDSFFSPSLGMGLRVYELMVAKTLLGAAECEVHSIAPAWQREEIASLVCNPSFEPEWALWVVGERKAGFWVQLTEAEKNIWYATRDDPEMPHSLSVTNFQRKLDTHLGGAICDIWSRVLSQTRYPQKPLICACDGTMYHFAYSRKGIPSTAGKTWSPLEGTIPGKLVDLSRILKNYVQDCGQSSLQIVRRIEEHIA